MTGLDRLDERMILVIDVDRHRPAEAILMDVVHPIRPFRDDDQGRIASQ
jgi:hypothetical protein